MKKKLFCQHRDVFNNYFIQFYKLVISLFKNFGQNFGLFLNFGNFKLMMAKDEKVNITVAREQSFSPWTNTSRQFY
jgi:hypothetical protein